MEIKKDNAIKIEPTTEDDPAEDSEYMSHVDQHFEEPEMNERNFRISKKRLMQIIREEAKSTKKYDDNKNLKGDQDKLPDHLQKGIIQKADPNDPDLDESHPPEYGAKKGSKRAKQLDATQADLKSGGPERVARAYRRRENMENKERNKPGYKNKPRKDTKKESYMRMRISESRLRNLIRKILTEELSKATKETLKKKAEKRGLTPSSVEAEFKKGLAAWASSGSRKGMSQHQWAHARVNSATPSKSWAVVKKSKAKKKK